MNKFKITKEAALSAGVMIGTAALGLMKIFDDKNKKTAEKEEMIKEIMERLSNQD